MTARANYADDFGVSGRIVASTAALEIIAGAILMTLSPRWGMLASLVWLAMLIGTIVAVCAVAMPRRPRMVLIAGLMTLFVLTGARLDLLGTIGKDVAAHDAGEDGAPRIVAQQISSDALRTRQLPGVADPVAPQAWTARIDALASSLSQAPDVRVIVRSITVDRTIEPNRIAFDWSIVAGEARKYCGSITIAAADRQAVLEQITATLRFARDRSRAAGMPVCY